MSYQALITNQQCSKYFSYIVVVSFIGGGNRSTGENYPSVAILYTNKF